MIIGIISLVAALIAAWFVWLAYQQRRASGNWHSTDGYVLSVQTFSVDQEYGVVIVYRYQVAQQLYQSEQQGFDIHNPTPLFSLAEAEQYAAQIMKKPEVLVWFNRNNPAESLVTKKPPKGFMVCMSLSALALFILALISVLLF